MQSETAEQTPSKSKLVPPPLLKCCFDKFYTLDHNEKYEQFLIELGVSKDVRMKATNSRPTVMLCLQNNAYVLSTMYPEGKTVRVRFVPGEKSYRRRPGGKLIECRFDLMDNILTERLTVEGVDIKTERVFTKAEMLVTMEMNGVTCFRRFSVDSSRHSIDTETSRRSLLFSSVDLNLPQELESFVEEEVSLQSETSEVSDIC